MTARASFWLAGPRAECGVKGRGSRWRWADAVMESWAETTREGETGWGLVGKRRAAAVMGLRAKTREDGNRGRIPFLFLFKFSKAIFKSKVKSIQLQFQIYFSSQIKMRNFGKFSKIIYLHFLNAFISYFSFLLLQSQFQKHFKFILNFEFNYSLQ